MQGADVAIQSPTGSGKTLAYLLPLLSRMLGPVLGAAEAESAAESAAATSHASGGGSSGGGTSASSGRSDSGGGSSGSSGKAARGRRQQLQALVVAPSQELCMQIVRVAQGLLPPQLRSAVQQCIGGANARRQADALAEHRPLLVVGTPGRVAKFLVRGVIQARSCGVLVLDEADRLLAREYREDMAVITATVGAALAQRRGPQPTTAAHSLGAAAAAAPPAASAGRQTLLVSATLQAASLEALRPWCARAPLHVLGGGAWHAGGGALGGGAGGGAGGADAPGAAGGGGGAAGEPPGALRRHGVGAQQLPRWQQQQQLERAGQQEGQQAQQQREGPAPSGVGAALPPQLQHWYVVERRVRVVDAVRRCIHALGSGRALVFMGKQQQLQDTAAKLAARSMPVAILHAGLHRHERSAAVNALAAGRVRALVATDVAARGLDLPAVELVICMGAPRGEREYVHRAGRAGRAGAPGVVVSVVQGGGDVEALRRLAGRLGLRLRAGEVRGGVLREVAAEGGRAAGSGGIGGGSNAGAYGGGSGDSDVGDVGGHGGGSGDSDVGDVGGHGGGSGSSGGAGGQGAGEECEQRGVGLQPAGGVGGSVAGGWAALAEPAGSDVGGC